MIKLNDEQKRKLKELNFVLTGGETYCKSYANYEEVKDKKYDTDKFECMMDLVINPVDDERNIIIIVDTYHSGSDWSGSEFSFETDELFFDMLVLNKIGIL